MNIFVVIGIVVVFCVIVAGVLIVSNVNKQHERDEDLFKFKLESILSNDNMTFDEQKSDALELCRVTKGKLSAGAYFCLESINSEKL